MKFTIPYKDVNALRHLTCYCPSGPMSGVLIWDFDWPASKIDFGLRAPLPALRLLRIDTKYDYVVFEYKK